MCARSHSAGGLTCARRAGPPPKPASARRPARPRHLPRGCERWLRPCWHPPLSILCRDPVEAVKSSFLKAFQPTVCHVTNRLSLTSVPANRRQPSVTDDHVSVTSFFVFAFHGRATVWVVHKKGTKFTTAAFGASPQRARARTCCHHQDRDRQKIPGPTRAPCSARGWLCAAPAKLRTCAANERLSLSACADGAPRPDGLAGQAGRAKKV